MQLAIPSAPRPVKLSQVPGAFVRVGVVAAIALVVTALLWALGARAQVWRSKERDFLENAIEVKGTVAEVALPPFEDRQTKPATLRVLYELDGKERAAGGVKMDALEAEGIGTGAKLLLLVDPRAPGAPREARYARGRGGLASLAGAGLGLGLLLTLAAVAWELRRAIRREVAPLRVGALVWLTLDAELPDTRAELVFPAHYFRDGVKHAVTARGRPGRAPVRNGEKVLAAVLPSQPSWVRVIDEELARTLGWYR